MDITTRSGILSLPSELVCHILGFSSSFQDVLHFAATCRRFQHLWQRNANFIYKYVSRTAIPCRRYARILLADQGGSQPNDPLNAQDVRQMARNSVRMEKTIKDIEWHMFSPLYEGTERYPFFGYGSIYAEEQWMPYFSKSESPRVIRTMYQLWGLLLLGYEAKQSRMKSYRFKDLAVLYQTHSLYEVKYALKVEGLDEKQLSRELKDIHNEVYSHCGQDIIKITEWPRLRSTVYPKDFYEIVCWWDRRYSREKFKRMVTTPRDGCPPNPELWYDTSEDELMGWLIEPSIMRH
ncbi:hypothetical protein BO71DRAFT_439964 [Aspergillus ellipticus CBS 707.79]|uniref:F-box domain-containing protein n=1 Tax=Aspergillus ellipticus CBS 707.79 TaxID=1448320 RepID=A0A319EWF7_9EURO|nr:hypothetical protein BO71DRAFT_439964 [Aspergillus ellipticus CBS 707.79]